MEKYENIVCRPLLRSGGRRRRNKEKNYENRCLRSASRRKARY